MPTNIVASTASNTTRPSTHRFTAACTIRGDGSAIAGVNSSNQDLSQVRATLKPDASKGEVTLALKVEGHAADGAAVIPAGARFSLTPETPARSSGGAILTFRYLYAGQQKSTILYLNAATLARFASRG